MLFSSILLILNQALINYAPGASAIPTSSVTMVTGITQDIFPLVLALSISYHLSIYFGVDRAMGTILALSVFLLDTSMVIGLGQVEVHVHAFDASVETVLAPIISLYAFAGFIRILTVTPYQPSINPMLTRSIRVLLPFCLAFVFTIFVLQPIHYLVGQLTDVVQNGLQRAPEAISVAAWSLVSHVVWFFGLHGTNIVSLVTGRGLLGQELAPGLTWGVFLEIFVGLGGVGATLGLGLAVLLFSKDQHTRMIGLIGTPFAFFNISEVLLFGIPLVLNTGLLLPFLVAPLVNFGFAYLAVSYGMFDFKAVQLPWVTPLGLNSFLRTGSYQVVLFQLGQLAMTILIYAPFIHRHARSQSKTALRAALAQRLRLDDRLHSQHSRSFYNAQSYILQFNRETKEAIDVVIHNNLIIHYQPKISIEKQACVGFEALLRIQSEDGSIRGPYFLDTLEKAGFATLIDKWVCERVLNDVTLLRTKPTGKSISVNLHPDSLEDDRFIDQLIKDFKDLDVDFEIVERGFSGSPKLSVNVRRMRTAGLRLLVDDFGSGYSNLSTLSHLPVDAVKLDKSLLDGRADREGQVLYLTLTRLCMELGYQVIAEGVETEEDYDFVKSCGVSQVQGWYFAKAMPLADALRFVAFVNVAAAKAS